jgi:hypothetical protein
VEAQGGAPRRSKALRTVPICLLLLARGESSQGFLNAIKAFEPRSEALSADIQALLCRDTGEMPSLALTMKSSVMDKPHRPHPFSVIGSPRNLWSASHTEPLAVYITLPFLRAKVDPLSSPNPWPPGAVRKAGQGGVSRGPQVSGGLS